MDAKSWLDQATEKIAFDPDREAVRRELEGHLQDRQERYTARGFSPEEAEAAAVADMGDPAEIAEELGELHKPFWGYLWTLSKILLGLMAILFFISVCQNWYYWDPSSRAPDLTENTATISGGGKVSDFIELSGSVQRGWYWFSTSALTYRDGSDDFLLINLRTDPTLLWEKSVAYGAFMRRIVLTDSNGGRYCLLEENTNIAPSEREPGTFFQSVSGFTDAYATWYQFVIPLEEARFPDWVEIALNQDQPVFRLDFQEGVLRDD